MAHHHVVKVGIELPCDTTRYARYECAIRLLAHVTPECSAAVEGCDLTVSGETETQLQAYMAHLHYLVRCDTVVIWIDGSRYETAMDTRLFHMLDTHDATYRMLR